MSKDIEQIYATNPVMSLSDDDLFYLGQAFSGSHLDGAIKKSNLQSSLAGSNYTIFWVSDHALPGGNGSPTRPYGTVAEAYAAGIAFSYPFLVCLYPGTYFEPSTVLSLVKDSGFIGLGSENTTLVLGATTLDQTSWTTTGTVATLTLSGLTFSTTGAGLFLSVPTFSDGSMLIRDVIFKQQASESYVWENFVDEINIADCDFSNINPKFFGCFLRDVGSKFSTLNVCTYDPDVGTPINNSRLTANCSKIINLFLKSQTGNLVHAILNSLDVKDMSSFFVEGDDITIWKSANVPNPTITSGTPTINNVDEGTSVFANFAVPTNYTPTNNTVTGHLQGIDTALGGGGSGVSTVVVSSGYQLVANNTRYVIPSTFAGKVFFQTPPTMAVGFWFAIEGAGGNPLSNWNLSTQLNQSLINGSDITDVGSNIYAILEPASPTDRVSFICTAADQDVSVEFSSSAGLTLYEQTTVDSTLYQVIAASPLSFHAMSLADTSYVGDLIEVQRSSDSTTTFVAPDLTGRASPLSTVSAGGTLAAWMAGIDINIVQWFDQGLSGVNLAASGTVYWFDAVGNMKSINGNPAAGFLGGANMEGTYPSSYTGTDLNIIGVGQITQFVGSESSMCVLYDPANGDDYASPLDCVGFYENIAETNFTTLRDGNLSVKSFGALNTRLLVTTSFDNVNNIASVNLSNGTTVPSTGAFDFNKILLAARYVSGAPTAYGYYNIAGMSVWGTLSPGDFVTIQLWMNNNL